MENISQSNRDVNQPWKTFKDSLRKAAKRHKPAMKSKLRQSKPWISSTLARKVKKRDKLYQKCKKRKKENIEERFKQLKTECQKELRQEHNNYVESLLADKGPATPAKNSGSMSGTKDLKLWA